MALSMDTSDDQIQILKNWMLTAIGTFRGEYAKLTKLERKYLSPNALFTDPSQIEIFWASKPVEYQLFVLFHDSNRNDGEIIINGPYNHSEIIQNVIKIMEEPRWQKKAPIDHELDSFFDTDIGDREHKYSDLFVGVFDNFLRSIQNLPLHSVPKGLIFSFPLGDHDYCALYYGSITEVKIQDLARISDIEYAKQQAMKIKNGAIIESQISFDSVNTKEYITIFGAYYYPGVRIGDNVELSFQEKLQGPNILEYPKYEYQFIFDQKVGYYDRYGVVLIETTAEAEAKKILNTIFGVSLLFNIEAYPVRTSEMLETKRLSNYNPIGKSLGSYQWKLSVSKRDSPRNFGGLRRTKINFATMENILKIAEKVWQNGDLNDSLLFLLEAFSHLENSEYSQAFIFSWLIIEKMITKKFDQFLMEKKINKNRAKKFRNPEKWSTANKIEVLSLNEILKDAEYTFLSEFNTKRNKLVHTGNRISDSDAKNVYEFSFQIIKSTIDMI